MKKSYLSLLTVAIVVSSIIIAGCTTSNQVNQGSSSETSTNASTSLTTTAATSRTATTTSKVTPSPSASPTASPTAATPTPTGKIATSIGFAGDPTVKKGDSLYIDVLVSGIRICSEGAVTATIGTVSPGDPSNCYYTAYLGTSSLNPGTYDVTLKFAGDSTHQPSQSTSKITITP